MTSDQPRQPDASSPGILDNCSDLRQLASEATDIRHLEAKLPPAPWVLWTSNSFRRIKSEDGKDVLSAYAQPSDGHPDLSMREDRLAALVEIRNALPALLDELDGLKAQVRSAVDGAQSEWSGEITRLRSELDAARAERDPLKHLVEFISPALFVLRDICNRAKLAAGKAKAEEMIAEVQHVLSGAAGLPCSHEARARAAESSLAALKGEVERLKATWPIATDGPHPPGDQRVWLARQLMDSRLSDSEAFGIVAYHDDIMEAGPASRSAKMAKALEEIADSHIPDAPTDSAGDELVWAQRHVGKLRSIARAALTGEK